MELRGQRLCMFSELRHNFQVSKTGCPGRGVSSWTQVQRPRRVLIWAVSLLLCLLMPARLWLMCQKWLPQVPKVLFTQLQAGAGYSCSREYQGLLIWVSSMKIKASRGPMHVVLLLSFPRVLPDVHRGSSTLGTLSIVDFPSRRNVQVKNCLFQD